MIEKKRGEWVPSENSPETQLRRVLAKYKLEKEGTITQEVLEFKERRQAQTAQTRKGFVGVEPSNCSKRQRIR